jgi:hypothetical protein
MWSSTIGTISPVSAIVWGGSGQKVVASIGLACGGGGKGALAVPLPGWNDTVMI